jgi:hypothetical protein
MRLSQHSGSRGFLEVYSSPDTGEELLRQGASTTRGLGTEEYDEATGYTTITFDYNTVGLPSKWYKPGEGVITRDVGQIRQVAVIVVDLSQDPPVLISFDGEVTVKGPHPEVFTDFDEWAAPICRALGA